MLAWARKCPLMQASCSRKRRAVEALATDDPRGQLIWESWTSPNLGWSQRTLPTCRRTCRCASHLHTVRLTCTQCVTCKYTLRQLWNVARTLRAHSISYGCDKTTCLSGAVAGYDKLLSLDIAIDKHNCTMLHKRTPAPPGTRIESWGLCPGAFAVRGLMISIRQLQSMCIPHPIPKAQVALQSNAQTHHLLACHCCKRCGVPPDRPSSPPWHHTNPVAASTLVGRKTLQCTRMAHT